jgi:hypothetical protein
MFVYDRNKYEFGSRENKEQINSRQVCYHSFQNLLPLHLLFKEIKIKVYKIVILHVVLYECELGVSP